MQPNNTAQTSNTLALDHQCESPTAKTLRHPSSTVPLAKELSDKAKVRHIFDDLQSGSLISIGQLCDNDCVALFTKYDVKICMDGKVIIVGQRNDVNGLWNVPLTPKETQTPQTQQSANGAIKSQNQEA